jgi:hypothetical protein
MQHFTLVPGSRPLNLSQAEPKPGDVKKAGKPSNRHLQLASNDRGRRTVLIRIPGSSLDGHLLTNAIQEDGKARALPWDITSIAPIEVGDSPPISRKQDSQVDMDQEAEEKAKVQRPRMPWKVTLRDENEAQRFIRTWHRRPFQIDKSQEHVSIIRVELLW